MKPFPDFGISERLPGETKTDYSRRFYEHIDKQYQDRAAERVRHAVTNTLIGIGFIMLMVTLGISIM